MPAAVNLAEYDRSVSHEQCLQTMQPLHLRSLDVDLYEVDTLMFEQRREYLVTLETGDRFSTRYWHSSGVFEPGIGIICREEEGPQSGLVGQREIQRNDVAQMIDVEQQSSERGFGGLEANDLAKPRELREMYACTPIFAPTSTTMPSGGMNFAQMAMASRSNWVVISNSMPISLAGSKKNSCPR